MSVRIGRNGDAEIQLTINDGVGEVTNVRLISTTQSVHIEFYDGSGNVIYQNTLSAPLDQVINLSPGERPQLIEGSYHGVPILKVPYAFYPA